MLFHLRPLLLLEGIRLQHHQHLYVEKNKSKNKIFGGKTFDASSYRHRIPQLSLLLLLGIGILLFKEEHRNLSAEKNDKGNGPRRNSIPNILLTILHVIWFNNNAPPRVSTISRANFIEPLRLATISPRLKK